MSDMPNIAQVGALIGDPVRALILGLLMDGSERPAGELAARAGVSPQGVSSHLARLLDGGLLSVRQHGRHRYFALRNADVAHAIETLSVVAPPSRSLRIDPALRHARRCYDHLAGEVGVALCDRLVARQFVVAGGDGYRVSDSGWNWAREFGLGEPQTRRALVRPCLDWTERRTHLAGWFGAALYALLEDKGAVKRRSGERIVDVTGPGRRFLARHFDLAGL